MVVIKAAKNVAQRLPQTPVNVRRVLSPFTFYTVPAGKKAIVRGQAVCTGLGAAASVRLNAAGVRIVEWQAAGTLGTKVLAVDMYYPVDIELDAGDTLDYDQDAGTNGELNVNVQVWESEA